MSPSQIHSVCKGLISLRRHTLHAGESQLPTVMGKNENHGDSGEPEDSPTERSSIVANMEIMCDCLFTKIISIIIPNTRSFITESIKDILKLCYDLNYYDKNLTVALEKEIELRLKSLDDPSVFETIGDSSHSQLANGILADLKNSQLFFRKRLALELGWCRGLIRTIVERKKTV
jgi:hypothetical protein